MRRRYFGFLVEVNLRVYGFFFGSVKCVFIWYGFLLVVGICSDVRFLEV